MPPIDPSQAAAVGVGVALLLLFAIGALLLVAIVVGLALYARSQNGLRLPRWKSRLMMDRVTKQIRDEAEAAFAPTVARSFGYETSEE